MCVGTLKYSAWQNLNGWLICIKNLCDYYEFICVPCQLSTEGCYINEYECHHTIIFSQFDKMDGSVFKGLKVRYVILYKWC